MSGYSDRWWQSADGLRLHYRDYPGSPDKPAVVCLPGLTRNARDFANLAARLAGEWRVLCPEMRGRGQSEPAADWHSYSVRQYVADVEALLDQAGVTRFVAVGTSLGGIMTMVMALDELGKTGRRIAGALLNDIGPVLEAAGLEHIAAYVGQARAYASWDEAAAAVAAVQSVNFPDYNSADWLRMARQLLAETGNGDIVFDYDIDIARTFAPENGTGADLWPAFDALAGRPVLLVRGGLSELLSAATFTRMCERLPDAMAVTVPRIGHVPTLDEPELVVAIERWLSRVA